MSIDLSALFDTAEAVVRQLVETSGTTVSFGRLEEGRGQGTTDPVTLVWTPDVPDVVVGETPAFLGPLGSAAQTVGQREDLTATEVQRGDMTVVLLPDVEEIQEQDIMTVLTCRDARLVGREFDVVTFLDNSAGAARVLHARPRTLGPGAT